MGTIAKIAVALPLLATFAAPVAGASEREGRDFLLYKVTSARGWMEMPYQQHFTGTCEGDCTEEGSVVYRARLSRTGIARGEFYRRHRGGAEWLVQGGPHGRLLDCADREAQERAGLRFTPRGRRVRVTLSPKIGQGYLDGVCEGPDEAAALASFRFPSRVYPVRHFLRRGVVLRLSGRRTFSNVDGSSDRRYSGVVEARFQIVMRRVRCRARNFGCPLLGPDNF